MSQKTITIDDSSGEQLPDGSDFIAVDIREVTVSGTVFVGSYDFANYGSLASWASKLDPVAIDVTPPKVVK